MWSVLNYWYNGGNSYIGGHDGDHDKDLDVN